MAYTALKLESPNYVPVTFTAAAAYSAGDIVKLENVIGIVFEDAETGDDLVVIGQADKIVVPKSTDSVEGVFAAGDAVYYDAGDATFNNASSGNTRVGIALEAALAADTEVLIYLNGLENA